MQHEQQYVPEGVTEAKRVIYLFDCDKGGTGCFHVDDATVHMKPIGMGSNQEPNS